MATQPKNNKQTITVKTNEENPEPLEIIAESIIEISQAVKKINQSRVDRKVVLLLIKHQTGISFSQIEKVLDAAANLEKHYIKQVAKK